jgi:hypothetical protein
MKTTIKTPKMPAGALPLKPLFTTLLLLLLAGSLWSCELFNKDRTPEPTPVPVPEPLPKPTSTPKPDSVPPPAPTPKPDSIPQPAPQQPPPNPTPQPDPNPGPVSKLPTEMLGKWSKGSFNMVNFFTYDRKDLGKGYESSRALSFTPDGQVEMYLYFHTYDGYCHSHAFTYIKGEARVEGNVLHIKARSGKYRGVYGSLCSLSLKDFARDMTPEEVANSVYKFYWSRQHYNGKEYLVTKFEPNAEDSASDFFVKTDW